MNETSIPEMPQEPHEYRPGSCNLGEEEVRRRYRIGFIGLIAFALFALGDWYFEWPRGFRFTAFAPLFYSFSGFIQARNRFCYVYGFQGVWRTTGQRKFSRTHDPDHLRQDRRRAMMIVLSTAVLSILATWLYYVLG